MQNPNALYIDPVYMVEKDKPDTLLGWQVTLQRKGKVEQGGPYRKKTAMAKAKLLASRYNLEIKVAKEK